MSRLIPFACVTLLIAGAMLHAVEKKERTKTTKFQIESGQLKLPGAIVFEAGGEKLKSESEESLWVIADFLEAKKDITLLRIEGHVANADNAKTHQALSEKRAMAVARWLVSKGVDCKRLIAVGFGDTKPVEANDTPAGRAANSRIEARPAAMRGRLIGGMDADGGGKSAGDVCEKK